MAIKLEFINIIIPRQNVEKYYPGGFTGYLRDHPYMEEDPLYFYDDFLVREGSMSPQGAENIVKQWESRGLHPFSTDHGQQKWNELCVVDFLAGPTLPCDWIVVGHSQVKHRDDPAPFVEDPDEDII